MIIICKFFVFSVDCGIYLGYGCNILAMSLSTGGDEVRGVV